jgi:ribonuclease P protein component
VPEILHRFLWAVESIDFTLSALPYPQREQEKNLDLTRLQRAGSNTALFRIGHANEAETYLPAFQDAARANARFSCPQPYRKGPRCFARPTGKGPEAPGRVGSVPGELGGVRRARFGLGAERKLASKAEFERLLREGERRKRSGFTFFVAMRSAGPARLGILISRKHAAKSTVRNRIKRCIREAFRLEHAGLGPMDLLVRPPFGARPGAQMFVQLRRLFVELGK